MADTVHKGTTVARVTSVPPVAAASPPPSATSSTREAAAHPRDPRAPAEHGALQDTPDEKVALVSSRQAVSLSAGPRAEIVIDVNDDDADSTDSRAWGLR